jgi:hypothetical protein
LGYTHYYCRPQELDQETFNKAIKDCKSVIEASKIPVAFEFDDPNKPPELSEDQLHLNGVDSDGHETFVIPKYFCGRIVDGDCFDFCKTSRKPYDLVVMVCLVVFKHHFGDKFVVRSDGYSEEWEPARILCQNTLGYGAEFKLYER